MVRKSRYNLTPAARRQRQQPAWQRFFVSQRFLALIFLVMIIAVIFPLIKTVSQRRIIDREIAELKAENNAYRDKNEGLRDMIEYLQSDANLEEQARLNLGLKKPNEEVVVVTRKAAVAETPAPVVNDSRTANWDRWVAYFFK